MCITTGCYNLKIAFILLKMLFQFNYSRFILIIQVNMYIFLSIGSCCFSKCF